MNKKLLYLTLLVIVLVLPTITNAATATDIATAVQRAAVGVGGPLIVVGWVVAGILYLTSAGSPERTGVAKKAAFAALIGTVLVLLSLGAVGFVRDLFGIPVENSPF